MIQRTAAGMGALVLVFALTGAASAAETLSFQDGVGGYDGTQDTSIYGALGASWANANIDGADYADVNGGWAGLGLIRFNDIFAKYPWITDRVTGTSVITSATLTLRGYPALRDDGGGNPTYLAQMLTDWDSPTITWNNCTAIGNNSAGIQMDGVDAATTGDPGTLSFAPSGDTKVLDITAIVQNWSDGDPNYGLLFLDSTGNGFRFSSSDHATTSLHPMLTIEFERGIPEPATLSLLALGAVGLVARKRRRA